MYTIYADDTCIYDDISNQDEFRLIDPSWSMEDNTAGSLSFKMPVTNAGYNIVNRLNTKITLYRDGKYLWEGRVLSEDVDFNKTRSVVCEGELAYLNDTIQPQRELINPSVSSFLSAIISEHNSKVTSDKRFTLGTVTVTGKMQNEASADEYDDDIYVYTNFETSFEAISAKLIERSDALKDDTKGHFRIRHENGIRYLDYLKDYPSLSDQTIEFGKNLLNFTVDYDESEYCTVLIPLGERYGEGEVEGLEGYLDITDVNGGKNYLVNQNGYNSFGWIERVEHFDDITDDEELKEKGIEFLSKKQFGKMALEISAVDLSFLDVNYNHLNLLDEVRVISIPHGLDLLFPVTKVDIKLDDIGSSLYSLNKERDGESDFSLTNQSTIQEKKQEVTENAIITESERATAAETGLTQRIDITDSQIVAEVTRATGKEVELASRITVAEGNINLKVSKGDVTSQLNIEDEQIVLESGRLIINSDNFSLDASGNVVIGGDSIVKSEIDVGGGAFTVGKYGECSVRGLRLLNYMSSVNPDGSLGIDYLNNNRGTFAARFSELYGFGGNIINTTNISGQSVSHATTATSATIADKAKEAPWSGITNKPNLAYMSDLPTSTDELSVADYAGNGNAINFADTSGGSRGATIKYVDSKSSSDIRLKVDIGDLQDISENYMKLKPKRFKFNPIVSESEEKNHQRYGLIAQDVQGIDNDLIVVRSTYSGTPEEKLCGKYQLNINYQDLHAWHIQMIQDQQRKIEELEQRISVLEGDN